MSQPGQGVIVAHSAMDAYTHLARALDPVRVSSAAGRPLCVDGAMVMVFYTADGDVKAGLPCAVHMTGEVLRELLGMKP